MFIDMGQTLHTCAYALCMWTPTETVTTECILTFNLQSVFHSATSIQNPLCRLQSTQDCDDLGHGYLWTHGWTFPHPKQWSKYCVFMFYWGRLPKTHSSAGLGWQNWSKSMLRTLQSLAHQKLWFHLNSYYSLPLKSANEIQEYNGGFLLLCCKRIQVKCIALHDCFKFHCVSQKQLVWVSITIYDGNNTAMCNFELLLCEDTHRFLSHTAHGMLCYWRNLHYTDVVHWCILIYVTVAMDTFLFYIFFFNLQS